MWELLNVECIFFCVITCSSLIISPHFTGTVYGFLDYPTPSLIVNKQLTSLSVWIEETMLPIDYSFKYTSLVLKWYLFDIFRRRTEEP